jgi:hypothetical protein
VLLAVRDAPATPQPARACSVSLMTRSRLNGTSAFRAQRRGARVDRLRPASSPKLRPKDGVRARTRARRQRGRSCMGRAGNRVILRMCCCLVHRRRQKLADRPCAQGEEVLDQALTSAPGALFGDRGVCRPGSLLFSVFSAVLSLAPRSVFFIIDAAIATKQTQDVMVRNSDVFATT